MKRWTKCALASVVALGIQSAGRAEVVVAVAHNDNEATDAEFKFDGAPQPAQNDAAAKAEFDVIDGRRDRNGGDLAKLHDGWIPSEGDEPGENFFFNAGDDGGRLLVDLGRAIEIKQVNTYSWHPSSRGPQVYKLYASEGSGDKFDRRPGADVDPTTCGWTLVGEVDARPADGPVGGQYAVAISDSAGALGQYRFLLFAVSQTEDRDPFGNTFFSEIDVVEPSTELVAATSAGAPSGETIREVVEADGGKYRITIDTTEAPDLTDWVRAELAPVVRDWYPKIVGMLPSDGFDAPTEVEIDFTNSYRGVAAAAGTRIMCSPSWFRGELDREAKGAVVHELVHVVQSYGYGHRNPQATRTPGWLVEGIADYVRWFLYEPESRGAEINERNIANARHDASYRITANFLNWTVGKYGDDVVPKLNAAAREGRYSEDLWSELTDSSLPELGSAWRTALQRDVADVDDDAESDEAESDVEANTLTEEEQAAGWKLLFNGRNLDGWHTFKRDDVLPGWQVGNGAIVCADPHNAGDLCTDDMYGWFELELEYNISAGANSGIMFHVTDDGGAAWATGPEFQLEDNAKAADPIRCGWLYALYQPPIDPETDKPIDATKPAGEWNKVRLLISPEKCAHVINGVTYFEYVLGSDDFKQRVAESKFGEMPLFAKFDAGYLALQGDHGEVSFRNVKIRPIKAAE